MSKLTDEPQAAQQRVEQQEGVQQKGLQQEGVQESKPEQAPPKVEPQRAGGTDLSKFAPNEPDLAKIRLKQALLSIDPGQAKPQQQQEKQQRRLSM